MTAPPTIAELVVGAERRALARRGLHGRDPAGNPIVVGTVTIRSTPTRTRCRASRRGRSAARQQATSTACATSSSTTSYPDAVRHPNGIVAIDHLVVLTPDLDRTIDALASTGSSCGASARVRQATGAR